MANSFKTFLPEDIATTRTLLHEAIPITGTIASGTYGTNNIKEFSHGMFQSVYDYPYLSSSANHIFDITIGVYTGSAFNDHGGHDGQFAFVQNRKKINIYNQMSLLLNESDVSGNIRAFDKHGDNDTDTTDDMREVIFLSFARLLTKDEIKKDSFRLELFTSSNVEDSSGDQRGSLKTIGDYNAQTSYKTNSPAGEYGLLYTSSANLAEDPPIGHIYYQAGIVVLTASLFTGEYGAGTTTPTVRTNVDELFVSGTINDAADGFRFALKNISFNNTTELNSTIYFCRAHNTEFNYSSNPTYLSSSEVVVKGNNPMADPVAYITTVGLYSPDNELMGVAKVSEPLKKSPSNEVTLRCRLDY